MALDPGPIFDALATHALALGVFENVNGHPASSPPGYGLVYTIEFVDMTPIRSSGLAAASVRTQFAGSVYTPLEQEPADDVDPHVLTAAGLLWEAYIGDFTLGGLVRQVDVFGAYGGPLRARGAYPVVNGVKVRAIILDLPLVVDAVFPEAA